MKDPTEKILRSGVCRRTEYETRSLNVDGDAVDVNHWDTEAEARAFAPTLLGMDDGAGGKVVAWVLEKHVSYYPAHLAPRDPSVYKTLATGGDEDALDAGGWLGDFS